jgi:hypothetical protein
VLSLRQLHRPSDAEIRYERVALTEQDVLGFDVPVHDALAMRISERVSHLAGNPYGVVQRQLSLAPEPITKRLTLDVGHRVPELAAGFTRIEHGKDVGVLQASGGPDFPLKALRAERGSQVRVQHLERDLPIVLQILREVHRGHAAPANLAVEPIAVSQGTLELTYRSAVHELPSRG